MSKKMILLALVAINAALVALPATASAQEAHIEGVTTFTGTGSASSLTASGEPTVTCETTHLTNGIVNPGGTTGSFDLDLTGCHLSIFGFTAKCRTTGSALDNTVKATGSFHVITSNNKPALLMTLTPVTVVCAGISSATISGNSIATITSPACGAEAKELKFQFLATGSTQDDRLYTGVEYDLKFQTSGGSLVTAATTQAWTLESATAGKLNCT